MNGNTNNGNNTKITNTDISSGSSSAGSVSALTAEGSGLLGRNESQMQMLAQIQAQILECLEKLDSVIASQQRLEQQFVAQGVVSALAEQIGNNTSINA